MAEEEREEEQAPSFQDMLEAARTIAPFPDSSTERPVRQSVMAAAEPGSFDEMQFRLPQPGSNFSEDFVKGASQHLADFLSKSLTGQSQTPENIDSVGFRMGEMFFEGAAGGAAMGAGATRVSRAADQATGVRAKIRNFVSDFGQQFRARPLRTTAIEGNIGAIAGAGGYVASQEFPNSDAAQFIGELIAGFGAPVGYRLGKDALAKSATLLTGITPWSRAIRDNSMRMVAEERSRRTVSGQQSRAQARVTRAVGEVGDDARADVLENLDADLIPGARDLLSPAVRSRSQGLMALEQSVIKAANSGALSEEVMERFAAVNDLIIAELRRGGTAATAEDSIAHTRRMMELNLAHLDTLIEGRVQAAAYNADDSIRRSLESRSEELVNRQVRSHLELAMRESRAMETEAWKLLDVDAAAPTSNAIEAFNEVMSRPAFRSDMPGFASIFNPRSQKYIGTTSNVQDMHDWYSKFREVARNARSGKKPKWNRARIADDMADAIMRDMEMAQVPEGHEGVLASAIATSRTINDRFSRGTVGHILGRGADTGVAVPAQETLSRSLGVSLAPGSRQAFDDIMLAVDGNEGVRGAIKDYIRGRFIRTIDVDRQTGRFNVNAASRFLENNKDFFDRLPELRDEFATAIDKGDALAMRELSATNSLIRDPKVNKAIIFTGATPETAFNQIFESRNPRTAMRRLVRMAQMDKTGESVEGLKIAFMDNLMTQAQRSEPFMPGGERLVSGNRLAESMRQPGVRPAMLELFGREELARIAVIQRTADALEGGVRAKPSPEGVIGDEPSVGANVISRVIGAALGRQVAQATGGGTVQTPGVVSNLMQGLVQRGVRNPAARLLTDMIHDEKLFREMMDAEITPEGDLPRRARIRIQAWVAAQLFDLGEDDDGLETNN